MPPLVSIHAPTGGATGRVYVRLPNWGFQFTRPRGARHGPHPTRKPARSGFNSRAHGGRDPNSFWRSMTRRSFQFTRPRGARPWAQNAWPASARFQFTRPRGARRRTVAPLTLRRRFNSRAHGGRDFRTSSAVFCATCVSIHAPTGGATNYVDDYKIVDMFQFTRPRGARQPSKSAQVLRSAFQSTRPRGARQLIAEANRIMYGVSIHAPTGGATTTRAWPCPNMRFQFTRPRGARQAVLVGDGLGQRFNSRAHGGRDHYGRGGALGGVSFQFTRPRGARRSPAPAWRAA